MALQYKKHFGFLAGCLIEGERRDDITLVYKKMGFDRVYFAHSDSLLDYAQGNKINKQKKEWGAIYSLVFVRSGSSRFPGKCYEKVGEWESLKFLIKRIKKSKASDKIIVCTTLENGDDRIVQMAEEEGVLCYRGEENVVKRVEGLFNAFGRPHAFFRFTADNLFVDPVHIDEACKKFLEGNFDYYRHAKVIDGCDFEIIREAAWSSLFWYFANLLSDKESEYLTLFFKNGYFKEMQSMEYKIPVNWSEYRYTLDYKEDLENIRRVFAQLKDIDFNYSELGEVLLKNKNVYFPFNPENKALDIHISKRFIF